MAHQILLRYHKLFQRRVDGIEINVGDKAINAGIEAGRAFTVHIAIGGNEIGEDGEIGEPARVGRIRREAADAPGSGSAEN